MRPTWLKPPVRSSPLHPALLALGLAGCASTPHGPPPQCLPPANAQIQAELLFGLSMPAGGLITPSQFDVFVAAEIVPRFPDGLTVLPGAGRWRAPDGRMVVEGAKMVMVIAPDTQATAASLREIRQAYRTRFAQRSVGLITIGSCAAF